MKIFSNDELREIERYTIDQEGVSSLDLIENAAEAIASEITARWLPSMRLMVIAGWGNNGADALATARILAGRGYRPEVYLFNIGGHRLSPECRICRDRLMQTEGDITLYEILGNEPFQWPETSADTLIIDGLFGSGLTKTLPVSFQMFVRSINQSDATVVSIDIPSGLFSDWNSQVSVENVIHATLTLALGAPRLAFFIEDNARAIGEWKVLDIGLNPTAIQNAPYSFYLVERPTVRHFLRPRNSFCSKADFGSALLCCGSRGMFGAAILASAGALRAGAGKVTVHSASSGLTTLQTAQPCAMFSPDINDNAITAIPSTDRYNVVALGPGMGTADKTIEALELFLKTRTEHDAPIVLDADALNCIAKRPRMLSYLPMLTVLTPHDGEFDRIFGNHPSHEARLRKAIEVAQYHRIIIVLKGRFTAIVRPDGKVFFNSSGSPAMATGGSGDVLTGVIAGFMAQGFKPEKATFIGCYVHGVAGELAAMTQGEYGTTAMDIAQNIGRAILRIQE